MCICGGVCRNTNILIILKLWYKYNAYVYGDVYVDITRSIAEVTASTDLFLSFNHLKDY